MELNEWKKSQSADLNEETHATNMNMPINQNSDQQSVVAAASRLAKWHDRFNWHPDVYRPNICTDPYYRQQRFKKRTRADCLPRGLIKTHTHTRTWCRFPQHRCSASRLPSMPLDPASSIPSCPTWRHFQCSWGYIRAILVARDTSTCTL